MADTPVSMPKYPGQVPTPEPVLAPEEAPPSRARRIAQNAAWFFLGIFSLTFFTLAKLPDDRIKTFVQGNLANLLASRGITLTTGESKVSFLWGISYVMKDVTLNFPPPEQPAHIEKIEIFPSIFPLFLGRLGAEIRIKNTGGELNLAAAMSGHTFSGSIDAQQFDLGKLGLMKVVFDVSASALISGKLDFSFSTDDLTTADGSVRLDLRKIVVNPQTISVLSIPMLEISEGKIDAAFDHGKGQIKTLRLGRQDSATDDIKANITGDITLGKTVTNSSMDLKAVFSLSDNLMKSFSLLSAFITPGKQPNGEYIYRLRGPLLSPNPTPGAS